MNLSCALLTGAWRRSMLTPTALAALAVLATAAGPVAASPANDSIVDAVALPQTGAAVTVVMSGATMAATDPSCGTLPYQSVWYRYTSPVDQFIQARVGATTGSTALRPRLAVWTGDPAAPTLVQCHPDAHEVQFNARAGSTYYLEVYSPAEGGQTLANLNVNPHAFVNPWSAVPPLNDLFWYAGEIPALPWSAVSDVGAAYGDSSYDPFTPCSTSGGVTFCYPFGDTQWYRFTATTTQEVDALFTSSYYSPVVQVVTGSLDQPVLVANSATPGKSKPGATRFTTQPGVTYYLEFGSAGAENLGDVYATLALRPAPPVTPGTVAAATVDKIYHRWVWTDPYYQKQTHVVVGVNVTCSLPIASVKVGFTLEQGSTRASGGGNAPCLNGAGSTTIDAIVSNSFKPGTASVAVTAADYDSNYYATAAAVPVKLKLALAP